MTFRSVLTLGAAAIGIGMLWSTAGRDAVQPVAITGSPVIPQSSPVNGVAEPRAIEMTAAPATSVEAPAAGAADHQSVVTEPVAAPVRADVPRGDWRTIAAQIRTEPPGRRKGELIDAFMDTQPESGLTRALIDSLPMETDAMVRDHMRLLIARQLDDDGADHLITLIRFRTDDTGLQEMLLDILQDVTSPQAMPTIRSVARDATVDFRQPLLFHALHALARSGTPEDLTAVFDRIKLAMPLGTSERAFVVTAALEARNPDGLPLLMSIASGQNTEFGDDGRLTATYALKNFAGEPGVQGLLQAIIAERSAFSTIAKEVVAASRNR